MGAPKIFRKPLRGATAVALLMAVATAALPVRAQNYTYLPWALGSSLLYPLRYLGYSAFGGGYGNGYGNAMFAGTSILNRATRGYGGMGYNGYSPYGNPNFANVNTNAQGDNSNPGVLKYGAFPPNINQNQNPNGNPNISSVNSAAGNYSNSNYPAPDATSLYPGSPAQPTPSGFQPYNPATVIPGQPYNAAGQPLNPNPAPNLQASGKHGKSKKNKTRNNQSQLQPQNQAQSQPPSAPAQAASAASTSTAPFAMAFINNVNSEYNGDIRKALANPSSRAWAESLGLSFKGNNKFAISDERSGIIERVLKDNSLDAVSKLNTVKILLGN